MFTLDCVIDKRREAVAAAQVLFRSSGVSSCLARQLVLLVRTQLEPQAFHDALDDRVLHADDVTRFSVDSFAPENLAGTHVEKLRSDTQSLAGLQKRRSQNRVNTELASGFGGVNGLILILHDH